MKYLGKLTKASKIVFVLWTINAAYMFFSGKSSVGLLKSVIIWIFGCFMFVGTVQLLTDRKGKEEKFKKLEDDPVDLERFARECNAYVVREERKEQNNNQANTYMSEEEFEKEISEIEESLNEIDKEISEIKSELYSQIDIYEADQNLKRAKELLDIANKTTDREEFYNSIGEIKSILKELSKYEGKLPFIGSPSVDLMELERIEQNQIELLEKRIEEKSKTAIGETEIAPIQEEKPIVYKNIPIDGVDELFYNAGHFIIEKDKASIGMIQRLFKIGFNRAARIMDQLSDCGIVGEEGTSLRKVLMNKEQFEQLIEEIIPKNETNNSQEETKSIEVILQDAKAVLKDKFDIEVDYSSDGESLKILKNIIIPSASNENQIEIINTLMKYNSPKTMNLVLIDTSIINYDMYHAAPNLLLPIITDRSKIDTLVSWLNSEMKGRIDKFVEYRAKNIESFNEKNEDMAYPRIICITNEAKEFFDITSEPLENLFMNSNMVGIYFILFSRFSLKGLSLGIIGELLEVFTDTDLRLLLQSESANIGQSISRNFDDMEGHQFEYFCADILRKNGFEKVEVTQGSGDQGIDILAIKDGIKYGIQCKCYSSDIGNKAVQEAFSGKAFYNCHVGVVLANRYFTASAKELAEKSGVLLWDRDKLNEMIEYKD